MRRRGGGAVGVRARVRAALWWCWWMGCVAVTGVKRGEAGATAMAAAVEGVCPPGEPEVQRFPSTDELSQGVGARVLAATQAAADKDKFLVALSGGSLPKLLAAGLLDVADQIDFSKWHVFFADERYVAHDDPDSNLLACQENFLSKIKGIKPEHVYGIDISVPVEESAARYQAEIERVTGLSQANGDWPRFDLVMLGMGPDGHTCSLFPGHPLLEEKTKWVASIEDSPKPPPQRITLTYPVLNNADNVFFLAAGASKVDQIPQTAGLSNAQLAALETPPLPAALVRPTAGSLVWFVDEDAAAKL